MATKGSAAWTESLARRIHRKRFPERRHISGKPEHWPGVTSMTCKDTLKQLKAMGTAQDRKVYSRHGMKGDLYGVSYANLKKVAREIKVDHALARQLWETGNWVEGDMTCWSQSS